MPPSGASTIQYTVTVNDLASKRVDEIGNRLSRLKAPADKASKSLAELSVQRLDKVVGGMRDLSRASQDAFRSVGQIVAPLALITSAASIAGLAKITSDWAKLGTTLGNSAKRAGIGVDQLSALQGAARLAGSSAGALTAGMTSLNDNLTKAASGQSLEAVQAFNYLHIALRNADGSLKKVDQALPEVADALAKVKNPTIQAQLATMLFGGAADDLLPFLRRGSAGIAEYTEKAKKAGIINQAGAEAANLLREKQEYLTLSVEGLGYSIAEKLAPVVGPMLDDLTKWTQTNRELVGQGVADWVRGAVPEIEKFAKGANEVAQALGGWKTVIEGIIAINVAGWAAGTVAKFLPILRILALIPGSGVTAGVLASLGFGYEIMKDENADTRRQRGGVGIFGSPFPTDRNAYGEPTDPAALGSVIRPVLDEIAAAAAAGARAGGYRRALPATPLGSGPGAAGGGIMHWLGEHLNPFSAAHAAERPMAVQPGRQVGATSALPIGLRTNNPLNLQAGPGQDFQVAADGEHVGVFRSMQEGIAAEVRQLMRYQDVYKLNTVRDIVRKWVGHEAPAYVAAVAKSIGVSPDQPIDLHQRSVLESYIRGAAPWESRRLDEKDISAGVAAGMLPPGAAPGGPASVIPSIAPSGPPASIQGGSGRAPGAANDTTINGQANVRLSLAGFPPGTKATATTEGDLFSHAGPVRIESGMVGLGSAA